MSKQGALACGLVLMSAAAVPALPTTTIKHHLLEPSMHDTVAAAARALDKDLDALTDVLSTAELEKVPKVPLRAKPLVPPYPAPRPPRPRFSTAVEKVPKVPPYPAPRAPARGSAMP